MTKRWYCVYTQPNRENTAAQALRDARCEVFYPWYYGLVSHARKQTRVIRPLFPQYLFVNVGEDQGLHPVISARGVAGLVCGSVREGDDGEDEHGPLIVRAADVEAIRAACDAEGQLVDHKPRSDTPKRKALAEGTMVVLQRGPLRGQFGVVNFDDGEGPEVAVKLNIFGRELIAHVLAQDIETTRHVVLAAAR